MEPEVSPEADEASPESARIAQSLAELASYVETLKPNSHALGHIRKTLADPRLGPADIARAVEKDVSIATAVLRVVNSPFYGLGQRCTSIRHAVSLLGTHRVGEVVSTSVALTLLKEASSASPVVAAHSLGVASIARYLAPMIGVSAEDAFTAGLLHDVGLLVLLQQGRPGYGAWVADGHVTELDPADERAHGDVDHATVGAFATARWEIPSPMPEVVGLHHDWDKANAAPKDVRDLVVVLQAAEHLLPFLERYDTVSPERWAEIGESRALGALGVGFGSLEPIWPGLRQAAFRGRALLDESDLSTVVATKPDVALPPPPRKRGVGRWLAVGAAVLAVGAAAIAGLSYSGALSPGRGVGAQVAPP